MSDDERATLDTLTAYRQVIRGRVEHHEGRVVDAPGDALLAEFPSALEAVECALEIQSELAKRNSQLAEHRRMLFRIGINIGDVIEEDGGLYGDGVNIAARLEALADPGSMCISGNVFDQIEDKSPAQFEFIGEQEVKNIPKPVRVFRIAGEKAIASGFASGNRRRRLAMAFVILIGIGVIATAIWKVNLSLGPSVPSEQLGGPKLTTGPSIAVLPFVNMSGDPDQEYFADGITEDLIISLSKIQRLLVISRSSTFQYKGKSPDVRKVSRDLGVRYVMEGSVRTDGDQMRVSVQLVDAANGSHLWADRYDRPRKDIFAVQDDIILEVTKALDVYLVEGEQSRVWRRTTNNIKAYEHFLRGREYILRFTKEDLRLAEIELSKAIELDPNFALAYTQLTSVPLLSVILGYSENPDRDLERAIEIQLKGIELDDSVGYSYTQLGRVYMQRRQLVKALEYGKRGVTVEPNSGSANSVYAHMLEAARRPEEALAHINNALRVSPIPESWVPWLQGLCLRQLGRYEEAIAAYQWSIDLAPTFLWPHIYLVDAYVAAGRMNDAQAKAQEVVAMQPDFSTEEFFKLFVWYEDRSFLEEYAANLRAAGLT